VGPGPPERPSCRPLPLPEPPGRTFSSPLRCRSIRRSFITWH